MVAAFRFGTSPALQAGEVRLELNADTEMLNECMATLWSIDGSRRSMQEGSTQTCDASGRLHWTEQSPGTYRLIANAPGRQELDELLVLGDVGLDLGQRTLPPGATLAGHVRMAGGVVAGATVETSSGLRVITDSAGFYKFSGAPLGTLGLRAGRGQASTSIEIDVEAGKPNRMDLELTRPAARGVVGFRVQMNPVTVSHVVPGGVSHGTLQVGDRLLEVNGEPVASDFGELGEQLAGPIGEPISLRWSRDGETLSGEFERGSSHDLPD